MLKISTSWLSLLLLFLLGFTWGTGYSLARFAMTNGVHPLGYSLWQALGPAMLISTLACLSSEKLSLSPQHCRYYVACGLIGIVLPNTTIYFAASHLPAGLLAVIVNTVPIIAYPLALIAKVETFNKIRLIAVMLAISGLLLILLPHSNLPTLQMTNWLLIALFAPFCFAFFSVYTSRYSPPVSNSFSLAAGTLIVASLILLPITIISGHFYALHFPLTAVDKVILLEIILSSLGYILFFKLIKIAGPVYYSFVDTIVALTGLFWGYLLLQEKLTFWTGAAIMLILFSLILITKRQKPMIE